jgi:hypothetical protein
MRNPEKFMTAPTESERERPATAQRTIVTKVEARQGVTGHNVRYVLGFGLVAVIIAFVVIYAVYFV